MRLGKLGPAFGISAGCGVGVGFGLVGGAGIGAGFPGLQLGFGAGAGCGIGIGFGYGFGKGVAYDESGGDIQTSGDHSRTPEAFLTKYYLWRTHYAVLSGFSYFIEQFDIVFDELMESTRKLIKATSKEIDKWRRM
ncbi:keratin-associated protein 21-1-like [Panicum miliaceum]|uniref:Keratin-associated protein 21-1-like n=1 Tax=Panicum miliaceum TaxID=4540 RepID=A0A3L6SMS8_PANMI|nr:keratin-associated protein 21-1-like [Panicum miliaceum]